MSRRPLVVAGVVWLLALGALAALVAGGATPNLPRAYVAAWLVLVSLPLGALPVLMGLEAAGLGTIDITGALRLLLASLPLLALLIVPVLLDLSAIYPWPTANGSPATPGLAHRWFVPGFFAIRAIAYLVVWTGLSLFFVRPSPTSHRGLACLGLVVHLFVGTLAAYDWFMSLDAAFVSSAWGILVISTQCAFAITVAGLIALAAGTRAVLDRGIVLALLVVVGVATFVQFAAYLVVWSANLPKEIVWYQTRAQDALGPAFAVGAPVLLILAALTLLPEPLARSRIALMTAFATLCVVEVADLILLASPRDGFTVPIVRLDLVLGVGLAGLAALCAFVVVGGRQRVRHG
jgi:hypothetical protein